MTGTIKLSELVDGIQETIQDRFNDEVFWVSAQITGVSMREIDKRCYLTLEEYEDGRKIAEIKAVFWTTYYNEIKNFEKATGQVFKNGLEIICKVRVKFHKIYGLKVDVMQIDIAHTLGTLELQRQQTLERLIKENPKSIQLVDGTYRTYNNRLPLPLIIKKIALITAPNSDGQRDFQEEISKNKHGYSFIVKEYLTTIQGENAHKLIQEQLRQIDKSKDKFDAVAIVRGGGSQTDLKPFEEYELSKCVANFSIPIFTGIGHDRNQSIVDLMAREQKTPTKVASQFVDHNFEFENQLIELRTTFFDLAKEQIRGAKDELSNAKRIVKLSSPEATLSRGFAIITINDKIIIDPKDIREKSEIKTLLRDKIILSTVTKKTKNEKGIDI